MGSSVLRRPEIFMFISGIVMSFVLFEFFFSVPAVSDLVKWLQTFAVHVSFFAVWLGFLTAARIHITNIQRKTPGVWYFSIVMFIFALVPFFAALPQIAEPTVTTMIYTWPFTWVYTPLGAALYATTGFYIFSAAYRAFRARSLEAAVLLTAGCLVVLGNAPVGEIIWGQIPYINEWLQLTGQTPAMRSLALTAALGVVCFGLRVVSGAEKRVLLAGGE
ncbi:MAG: hypothetical protein N3E39_00500 [Candidatus Methanomethylicia archaeon]|nr:hypothetical protein [Candidatus Methanomethylicia archaeon]